jgi:predicted transposase YbfD/YdcC
VVQSAIAVADREPVAPAAPATVTEVCDDLLKLFRPVSDGRSGQGRDHPVAAVLALAAAAVVAGMKGYTAIAGWVKDVPPPVLADLYLRAGASPAPPPSKATIWRVLTDADADAFDATVGSWLMSSLSGEPAAQGAEGDDPPELVPARLDGKTVRGARDAAGNQRHLLAALVGRTAQSSVIAAQAEAGVKTNEVPMATVVLGQIDLHGTLVTADALHTVKATAEFIHKAGGEFALPVKENRKALFDALDALPWHQVPIAHSATDRGHGRITTRTTQVLPAPEDLPFPHVSQVYLIERHVSDLAGNPVSAVAALGVASPAADRASAADLARHVRGQWAIESLHWLRSTPCTRKTNPRSEPDPGLGSWQRYATWRSAPCACPDAQTLPKPPDGPAGQWTGHSPSSASLYDLETAVTPRLTAAAAAITGRARIP